MNIKIISMYENNNQVDPHLLSLIYDDSCLIPSFFNILNNPKFETNHIHLDHKWRQHLAKISNSPQLDFKTKIKILGCYLKSISHFHEYKNINLVDIKTHIEMTTSLIKSISNYTTFPKIIKYINLIKQTSTSPLDSNQKTLDIIFTETESTSSLLHQLALLFLCSLLLPPVESPSPNHSKFFETLFQTYPHILLHQTFKSIIWKSINFPPTLLSFNFLPNIQISFETHLLQSTTFLIDFTNFNEADGFLIFNQTFSLLLRNIELQISHINNFDVLFQLLNVCYRKSKPTQRCEILHRIFQSLKTRETSLNISHIRSSCYHAISTFDTFQSNTDEIDNIFTNYFLPVFINECTESCYTSLINIYTHWFPSLSQTCLNTLNTTLVSEIKNKSSNILHSRFIQIISCSDISSHFYNHHKTEIEFVIKNLTQPPFKTIHSQLALYYLKILSTSNDDFIQNEFFKTSIFEILFNVRNFVIYSESYLDSIIYFAASLFSHRMCKSVIDVVSQVLFHCPSSRLRFYLSHLNFQLLSDVKVTQFYDEFELNLMEMCKLFQRQNGYPSWSHFNRKRVFNLVMSFISILSLHKNIEYLHCHLPIAVILSGFGDNSRWTTKVIQKMKNIFLFDNMSESRCIATLTKLLFDTPLIDVHANGIVVKSLLHFNDAFIDTLLMVAVETWSDSCILSITHEEVAISESSDDKLFNRVLWEEWITFCSNLPKSYKYENKKIGSYSKEDMMNVSLSNLFVLCRENTFFESNKVSQKLIKNIENGIVLEKEARLKVQQSKSKIVNSSEIIKVIMSASNREHILDLYPILCEKMYVTVKSPVLCQQSVEILLQMADILLLHGHIGRLVAVVGIRLHGSHYKLPFDLISSRVEIQITTTISRLFSYVSTHSDLSLSFIFAMLSMICPVVASAMTSSQDEINFEYYKTIITLLTSLTSFQNFKNTQMSVNSMSIHLINNLFNLIIYRIESLSYDKTELIAMSVGMMKHISENLSLLVVSASDGLNVFISTLVSNSIHSLDIIRECCLFSLTAVSNFLNLIDSDVWILFNGNMILVSNDSNEIVTNIATDLVERFYLEFNESALFILLENVSHENSSITTAAAKGILAGLSQYPEFVDFSVLSLIDNYKIKLVECERAGNFDILVNERCGVINCIQVIVTLLDATNIKHVLNFIFFAVVKDKSNGIQTCFVDLAVFLCLKHGEKYHQLLFRELDLKSKSISKSKTVYDHLRKIIALMMANMYEYLPLDSPMIEIARTQLEVLLTSSKKNVQFLIALRYPDILDFSSPQFVNSIETLIERATNGDLNKKTQRGCALAIGALAQVNGVGFIHQFSIVKKIHDALSPNLALKVKSASVCLVKALFEMSFVMIYSYLPDLLIKISENAVLSGNSLFSKHCEKTCIKIMSKLTSFPLSYTIPKLLKLTQSFNIDISLFVLNLLSCISLSETDSLVPFVGYVTRTLLSDTKSLNDSHFKSLETSFKRLVTHIINPELKPHGFAFVYAFKSSSEKSIEFFGMISNIKFSHTIDAISACLLIPIIYKGIDGSNSSSGKIVTLRVIISVSYFTDDIILTMVFPFLLEKIKALTLDSVPDVRDKAAQAIGVVVRYCSQSEAFALLEEFEKALTTDNFIIQNGSAHAMAQVLGALNLEALSRVLDRVLIALDDDILSRKIHYGYLLLLTHLPHIFGEVLAEYTCKIIPAMIKYLSSSSSVISNAALLAGQSLINEFGNLALEHIIPHLEQGLLNPSWEVRFGSVKLLREALYTISGGSKPDLSKTTDLMDLNEEVSSKLNFEKISSVPDDIKNKMIAYLFFSRCDSDSNVKAESFKIWKHFVLPNQVTIISTVLPNIIDILIWCYSQPLAFHKEVADDCVKELIQKTSERVVKQILPLIITCFFDSARSGYTSAMVTLLNKYMSIVPSHLITDQASSFVGLLSTAIFSDDTCVQEASRFMISSIERIFGIETLHPLVERVIEKARNAEDREKAFTVLKFMLSQKSKKLFDKILDDVLSSLLDFELLMVVCQQVKSIMTPEQTLTILNYLVVQMTSSSDPKYMFQGAKNVISVLNSASLEIIILKLTDVSNQTPLNRLYIVSILLQFCIETDSTFINLLDHVHGFCMSLLHVDDEKIHLVILQIYRIVNRSPTRDVSRQNINFFLKEFNFQYGKYSAHRPEQLYFLQNATINTEPLFLMIKYALHYENDLVLSNSLTVLDSLVNMSSSASLISVAFFIVGSLIRVLTRFVRWQYKLTALKSLRNIMQALGDNPVPRLTLFAPQLIAVFVKLAMDPTTDMAVKKELCEDIVKLQNLPYDILKIMQELIESFHQDNNSSNL